MMNWEEFYKNIFLIIYFSFVQSNMKIHFEHFILFIKKKQLLLNAQKLDSEEFKKIIYLSPS